MIEVVFSDSAMGSLLCARDYGRGKFNGAAMALGAGQETAPAEMKAALARAQEAERRKWEAAVPMNVARADIFGFSLGLSQGPIAGDLWQGRRETLERLYSCYPDPDREKVVGDGISKGKRVLMDLLERARSGEAFRVWYSDQPDERCGLCWLMAELESCAWKGELFLIKLPEWEAGEDDTLVCCNGWGDVEPGQWSGYLRLQKKAPSVLPRVLAAEWRQLQRENAPLRAVISGKLRSVGEDFYDPFLLATLDEAPEEFHEAALIGQVLGKHPLGFGDGWLALRIEGLMEKGLLRPVTEPPAGHPKYHRMLKKQSIHPEQALPEGPGPQTG